MKIVGFSGSPRKNGNTTALFNHVFEELRKEGIETELVHLTSKDLHGCRACYKCFENKDRRCAVGTDAANEYIGRMLEAQGVILGSPSYFQDVTAEMKALIDRAGFVGLANGRMYRDKIGAMVSAFRRTGGVHTVETMSHFFFSNEFIVAGRALAVARDIGDLEKDQEGIEMARALGRRMAWMMKRLCL